MDQVGFMYQSLLIALETAASSTIPESFACLYFTVMFWGFRLDRPWFKMALFAALSAVSFSIFLLLPPEWRPLTFLGYGSVILALLRELPLRDRILTVVSLTVAFNLLELAAAFLAVSSGGADSTGLLADPRKLTPYLLTASALIAAVAAVMQRYRRHPGRRVHQFLHLRHNRLLFSCVLLLCGNIVAASTLFYFGMGHFSIGAVFLFFAAMSANLILVFLILRLMTTEKNRAVLSAQDTYIEEIHHLFTTIRGQRHDFLNHVQVIRSFVRTGKIKELDKYVTELVGEIVEINDLLQVGEPALAALIKSKMVYAVDRKIDFRYSFERMDRIGRSIASVDYVKIAGNLIDNAIDEVLSRPREERWIEVSGWTDDDHFYLSVSNPASELSAEAKERMFAPGYTTKSDTGHTGIGLSIVRDRVRFYQGELDVSTREGCVLSFRIKLPLRMRAIVP